MKARNPQTGNFETVYVKALDSMPVGTQIEYTGDTIPTGWEEVNDYSTSEVNTGKKWIDGKDIYRVVMELSSINETKAIPGYSSIDKIIDWKAIVRINNNNFTFMLPDINASYSTQTIGYITDGGFTIQSQRSNIVWKYGYVIIEYTKSS